MANPPPAYEYNNEINTIMDIFTTVIDNAVVTRYEKDPDNYERRFVKSIKPLYVWGIKQRTIYDIVNKAKNFTLPCVIINLKSIKGDKERLAAKFDRIRRNGNSRRNINYSRPTPIVLSMDVTILTKYRMDLFEIYGKLATQFQPYVTYSWYVPYKDIPKEEYEELKNKIEWDFNLDIDFNDKLTENQERRFSGKMSFQVEGWLFPNMKSDKGGTILDIGTSHIVPEELKNRILNEEAMDNLLVDVGIKEGAVTKYNNPREWNNAHPRIVNVFRAANTGTKILYFLMDKDRTFPFRMAHDSFLTLDGYNFAEADVLFVPLDKNPGIVTTLDRVSVDYYDNNLFPNKDTVEKKKSTLFGYRMKVENRTNNKITVNFGDIAYEGNFDIVVASCVDYDSVSNAIGTHLHTTELCRQNHHK